MSKTISAFQVGEIWKCFREDDYGNETDVAVIKIVSREESLGQIILKYETLEPFAMISARKQITATELFKWARWQKKQITEPSIFKKGAVYKMGNALYYVYFTVIDLHADRITIQYAGDERPTSLYLWELCEHECSLYWDAA